jgi:hypothetical protein
MSVKSRNILNTLPYTGAHICLPSPLYCDVGTGTLMYLVPVAEVDRMSEPQELDEVLLAFPAHAQSPQLVKRADELVKLLANRR